MLPITVRLKGVIFSHPLLDITIYGAYMHNKKLLFGLLGLMLFFLETSTVNAQVESQIGNGRTYYCLGLSDNAGVLHGSIRRVRDDRGVSYKRAIGEINLRISDLKRKIRLAKRRGRNTATLEAQLAIWNLTRLDVDKCRNFGITTPQPPAPQPTPVPTPQPTPPPSNVTSACDVVGGNNRISTKIIGGEQCSIGNSSVVYITMYDSRGRAQGACSGTVVAKPGATTSRQVIFAAHCMEGSSFVRINVAGGDMQSSYAAAYPNWSQGVTTEDGDVAIAVFPSDIPRRAMYAHSGGAVVGERGIIGGYGIDQNGNADENRLKGGFVNITRNTGYGMTIHYSGGSGANTCFGDSGGPLFVLRNNQWVLSGITSNGEKNDCGLGDNSNFASLQKPAVKAWINSVVPGLVP